VFSLAAALHYYSATTKEPWRQVAGYVDGHAKSGDLIVFYRGSGKVMFDYYFEREDVTQEVASVESSPITQREMREALAPAVEGHRRVWLVRHWSDNPHINKLLRKILVDSKGRMAYHDVYNRKIDDPYENWSTWYFQDHIVLFLFTERKSH
jgi:hypothetical protein